MESNSYVYIFLNPLKNGNYNYGKFKFNFEPFYVGKGKDNRINVHFQNKIITKKSNLLKVNIIKKIKASNLDIIKLKIYENITDYSSCRLEKSIIKLIGRRDLNLGPLSNLTNGGEGHSGYIQSTEHRKKKGLKVKGKLNGNFGRDISKEYGHKISNTLKGNIPVNRKPVQQFDLYGNLIKEYLSGNHAKKETGFSKIHEACQGKIKTVRGFIWKYKSL